MQFDLLSLESHRSEKDILTVFKLIQMVCMQGISLEHAGLSLLKSNTRGGGVRLLRDRVVNMTTSVLFKYIVLFKYNRATTMEQPSY